MKSAFADDFQKYTLLVDFYELTMSNGYFEENLMDRVGYFDYFFRRVPDAGGFVISAGLEQLIDYLKNLSFSDKDIEFLRGKKCFSEAFLTYLTHFKFECDVWAIPEGTPVFPGEPIVTVKGPIIQAQFIESMVLLLMNHQSLIATKANRIVRSAKGRGVLEFGTRRAHGRDGAIFGARAAYIGGCTGTACALAEKLYNIPSGGTMAHSWVQFFDDELEAFKTYAKTYKDNCILLIDTYNVLKSGLPNAIKTFKEVEGITHMGVRIDSGDISYLSKQVRKGLDAAGLQSCKIYISNSLDEYLIREILEEGAEVDVFGVGERLITSKSNPVLGGVYKLAAYERNGTMVPTIKISENVGKITNPGEKKVYRLMEINTGKAIADVITLEGEQIDETKEYTIFDPEFTWKKKRISQFKAVPLLKEIFRKGVCVYESPSIEAIKTHCEAQVNTLWPAILRFENPHVYYVDLSEKLWSLKQELIEKYTKRCE